MVSVSSPGKPAPDSRQSPEPAGLPDARRHARHDTANSAPDHRLAALGSTGAPKRKADPGSSEGESATPASVSSAKRARPNATLQREVPARSATDRFGSVTSDPACFEPGKLITQRVVSGRTGTASIEYRLSQVGLAVDIETLKNNAKLAPTAEGSLPKRLAQASPATSPATGYAAHKALARLRELHADATARKPVDVDSSRIHHLARACETSVARAVTVDTLKSLSAGIKIGHLGDMLDVQRCSLDHERETFAVEDRPSTFFVLNGNNDEGYVRALAAQIKDLEHVTIVVSGFGGHGTTDRFPVRTDKTEADRFAEILAQAGVKAKVVVEPFSTNSGENAQYVGELLAASASREPANVVVCGTPAAVLRQTLTYARQMPRERDRAITFSSGPPIPLHTYTTAADRLLSLRECFTLFSYLHNTAYLPAADSFNDGRKYTDMLKAVSAEPLAAMSRFREAMLSQDALANDGEVARELFSDSQGKFSLREVMNDLSFIKEPGFAARLCMPGKLSANEKQTLGRAHIALGKMFQEIEAGIERRPAGSSL